jgi:hypothetical protein
MTAAIKHHFLTSQGPPEWGSPITGPFNLVQAQLFVPGPPPKKAIVFVPGKVKGDIAK